MIVLPRRVFCGQSPLASNFVVFRFPAFRSFLSGDVFIAAQPARVDAGRQFEILDRAQVEVMAQRSVLHLGRGWCVADALNAPMNGCTLQNRSDFLVVTRW